MDEGSFTITANAERPGVRTSHHGDRQGDMTQYAARADVTYGDRRVTPELRTDQQGAVVDYQVTTRSGGENEAWRRCRTGRLNATVVSSRGTSAREYIVPAGSLLLDDEIIHHHWFLVMRSRDGGMPVVLPRRSNVQATITMSQVGEESVQIGTHDLGATHLRATLAGGEVHDIWVDKSGRLLKVALPSKGLVAVRDDPPPA
jgi:hypothetical protein